MKSGNGVFRDWGKKNLLAMDNDDYYAKYEIIIKKK